MSAPVCSRRVAAGFTPPPGSLSTLPVWWGPTDWCEFDVRGALTLHRDVCAEHHVAPDTVLAVARGMARFADARTGRECRPTNERLVDVVRVSLSTIQRARRVLKALGLVVEVTAGRSVMTLAERLRAWDRGSSHRRIAAEFALCSRRERRLSAVDNRRADLQVVDDDTPPVGKVVRTETLEIRGSLRSETESRKAAPRPLIPRSARPRPPRPVDMAPRRLVRRLQTRLAWLGGVHPHRLERLLSPYVHADWTDEDVCLAIQDRLAVMGKRVPAKLDRPWAYLAWLLRGVDPADRPSVVLDAHAAAERAHQQLVTHGAPCEHGAPGGDVVSPLIGQRVCPLCRAGR